MKRHPLSSCACISLVLSLIIPSAFAEEKTAMDKTLFFEDFSAGMDNWWAEGGEKVWVQDGRLHVKADPEEGKERIVSTVWCKKSFPADIRVEFDAHVIESSTDVNNINFFLCYSDPSGRPPAPGRPYLHRSLGQERGGP